MVSSRPEDQTRKFILAYRLSDDAIGVFEPPIRNSGIIGGKFLEYSRIAKPGINNESHANKYIINKSRDHIYYINILIGSSPERPEFYGPQDFYIGAVITVFRHKFRIVGADLYVLKFAEENQNQFPPQTLESLRQHLGNISGRLDARERTNIHLRRR